MKVYILSASNGSNYDIRNCVVFRYKEEADFVAKLCNEFILNNDQNDDFYENLQTKIKSLVKEQIYEYIFDYIESPNEGVVFEVEEVEYVM